jgi:hypothetical protein
MNIMRQLDRLEVVFFRTPQRGRNAPDPMKSFIVRGHGGEAAVDGVLRRRARGDVLVMSDGREIAIPYLPVALSGANGQRVWIAGPIEAPTSASVIDPKREYSFPE